MLEPAVLKIYSQKQSIRVVVLALLICFFTNDIQAQSTIELLQADYTEFDADLVDAERVIGNVKFKHDGVFMDCDSAYFYKKDNRIEAFGNIYVRQPDSFHLRGKYLEYDGLTKMALVKEDVTLRDDEMNLTTDAIRYDINKKSGYYTTGGDIQSGPDQLQSKVGVYDSRSKTFFFKDSVFLKNPEYEIDADTLQYNTISKVARFFGPTYITSEENTIFCNYGWYSTKENLSQFSKGVYIEGKSNKLFADSMVYNRNTGKGEAFGNLELIDTLEDVRIFGEEGYYNRLTKQTMVLGDPLAIKYYDSDSLLLMADTLIDQTDTLTNKRSLFAYHNAVIFSGDMQGIADSLVYSFSDEIINLYEIPVIWNEENQITGDTIRIVQANSQLDKMFVRGSSFIISDDGNAKFNQIKGRNMLAKFIESKLRTVLVKGNGQSVYYAKEDSVSYTGVNSIVCSDILIKVDSNKVREVVYYGMPEGGFYPLKDFPKSKEKLPQFQWLIEKRPEEGLFRKRYRPSHEKAKNSESTTIPSE
jgi:lipopolysaccharide export system protein LptA